ncbi:pimeloyl-ACP methyl ester carboxylesterase [Limimaricola variabilis]|uniref:Pimeloyl-ACP methyl ester carboxylesterase n=1 Tax=Limimaricola variabilis TaxID=1492771 RepID=A0ABR6HMQ5_9RHOB|nr:alpha/beta fold hydrolase [Limimaricola variabilis]MBB3711614.1 pimeloyl-ACP methyl ester carboxylesterase [Limimaricola variabilis]
MLNTILTGEPSDRPPLLIVHGLFGSARNWGVIARRLGEDRQVISVDMRNHGDSHWTESHDYFGMAEDLAEVLESHGRADVLGHSMGGKASMVLALTRPDLVRRLIVADIAPVSYGHDQIDNIRRMKQVDLERIGSRSEATEMLGDDLEAATAAFFLQSLDLKEKRWKLNLDVLERDMETILGFPEVEGRFDGPALFLSGANSNYVGEARHDAIHALFADPSFEVIEGAGHWLHAEKPREVEAAVRGFLEG